MDFIKTMIRLAEGLEFTEFAFKYDGRMYPVIKVENNHIVYKIPESRYPGKVFIGDDFTIRKVTRRGSKFVKGSMSHIIEIDRND